MAMRTMRTLEFAGKKQQVASTTGALNMEKIVVRLMCIDLWILIEFGRFARKLITLLRSMMEVLILMSLVAGLLYIVALSQLKLEITASNKGRYTNEVMKSVEKGFIGITDESNSQRNPEFEREITHLKNKALSLEFALRKMNSQLRTFNTRCRDDEDLADFASEAAGGSVLETPNTEPYYKPEHSTLAIFGLPLCRPNNFTPRKVIQPWSQAGECWAFRGQRGNVKIQLAYAAIIEQVTLEHIPLVASLTGKIDSAPREFRVRVLFPDSSVTIGSYIYKQYGPPSQTFPVTEEEYQKMPAKIVLLEIISNWGNPNYTCIYRFKVHGRISQQ